MRHYATLIWLINCLTILPFFSFGFFFVYFSYLLWDVYVCTNFVHNCIIKKQQRNNGQLKAFKSITLVCNLYSYKFKLNDFASLTFFSFLKKKKKNVPHINRKEYGYLHLFCPNIIKNSPLSFCYDLITYKQNIRISLFITWTHNHIRNSKNNVGFFLHSQRMTQSQCIKIKLTWFSF